MDSVKRATSSAGPDEKRPLRETGEFFFMPQLRLLWPNAQNCHAPKSAETWLEVAVTASAPGTRRGNKLSRNLAKDLFGIFVVAEAEESGLAEVMVASPFSEADLTNEFGLKPGATPHLSSQEALAPT